MLLANLAVFLALPLLVFGKIIMGPFSYSQGTFTVSWVTAADAPPSFDILLRKGAQRIPLVSNINSNLLTYTYSLPNTTPPGTNYKIQFVVHDPSDTTPEILDTSPAFTVQASDFNPTSASAISVASTSLTGIVATASAVSQSITSAIASASSAAASSASGASVTSAIVASIESSASTAIASISATATGLITTTYTTNGAVVTTVLNAASVSASAVSQSVASAISVASTSAAAAATSTTASSANSLLVSWTGLVVSTAGMALGAILVL